MNSQYLLIEYLHNLRHDRDTIKNQIENKYVDKFFQNYANYETIQLENFNECMNQSHTINCNLTFFGARSLGDYETLQQLRSKYNYDNFNEKSQTEKITKHVFNLFTARKRCEVISRYLNNKYKGTDFDSYCMDYSVYKNESVVYLEVSNNNYRGDG
jgi:hypothetical protein